MCFRSSQKALFHGTSSGLLSDLLALGADELGHTLSRLSVSFSDYLCHLSGLCLLRRSGPVPSRSRLRVPFQVVVCGWSLRRCFFGLLSVQAHPATDIEQCEGVKTGFGFHEIILYPIWLWRTGHKCSLKTLDLTSLLPG